MEGLIKGLAEVALGFVGGDHGDIPERQANHKGEERSRSIWAEVVSTGKHEVHEQEHGSSYGHHSTHRHARKDMEAEQESSLGHITSSWGSRKKNEFLVYDDEKKTWGLGSCWSALLQQHATPSVLHEVPKENWQMFKLPPSDQTYTNAVHYDTDTHPSRRELFDLSEAYNKLWELDLNR